MRSVGRHPHALDFYLPMFATGAEISGVERNICFKKGVRSTLLDS